MAAKTFQFYSNSDGATAELLWDDATMLASGVLIHVPQTGKTVNVSAHIAGKLIELVYPAGTDTTYTFKTPLPVTIGVNRLGLPKLDMSTWLGSVGVAVMN